MRRHRRRSGRFARQPSPGIVPRFARSVLWGLVFAPLPISSLCAAPPRRHCRAWSMRFRNAPRRGRHGRRDCACGTSEEGDAVPFDRASRLLSGPQRPQAPGNAGSRDGSGFSQAQPLCALSYRRSRRLVERCLGGRSWLRRGTVPSCAGARSCGGTAQGGCRGAAERGSRQSPLPS